MGEGDEGACGSKKATGGILVATEPFRTVTVAEYTKPPLKVLKLHRAEQPHE